jgi:hypothetical protein
MSQKKCPKCGENNPAEAVMCWSCYTPLTQGGAVSSRDDLGIMPPDGGALEAKQTAQPWQLGVMALFVVVVLVAGVRSFMSPAQREIITPPPPPNQNVTITLPDGNVSQIQPKLEVIQATMPQPEPTSPFTMVAPPYPDVEWATMAIVPTKSNISPVDAAKLAGFARQQVVDGRWKGYTIYVFADLQSAQVFKNYQDRRRGQFLMPTDYLALRATNIWPKAMAVYDYSKGRAAIRYPSSNPNSWWTIQRRFVPVRA